MNTTQLKSYAPEARKAFIASVTAQAARLGISAKEIAPAEVQGDVLLVNGKAFPKSAQGGRKKLIDRVKTHGFQATMDAVAYTWFNRMIAIRYMELHDYLDHGYRVLSNPDGSGRPEILDKAADVELPGLDRNKVVELKLDGTKDEELYRLLLKAQCNSLHKALPFLFEQIGDETELLLPPNLLHTDSLVRQLVQSIDEDLWQEIEIIGWLYQFYISEKKDEVIGKVVKSEDIPAATQLFTPNWIVKYMVQNSLGAQWLATYPHSSLKEQMEYYIEPAEQTDEVKAQLAAITPDSLNPEEITLIDPACGSGHILVEAYDLFKAIYLERGYREREAASLILTKNLFGLDIDSRAAQLSGFALMMKGRADDRRLFERDVKLHVMALVDSAGLDVDELVQGVALEPFGLKEQEVRGLKKLFEQATTFGSLIQVPDALAKKLPALRKLSEASSGDMFVAEALECLEPLVQQAEILDRQYDSVVANPPYMGFKTLNSVVKKFVEEQYPDSKKDLFAAFMERGFTMAKKSGYQGMVTLQSWMFLPAFESLRARILKDKTLLSMVHMESGVMGIAFGVAATLLRNVRIADKVANYCYVRLRELTAQGRPTEFPPRNSRLAKTDQGEFFRIPGHPIAYWVPNTVREAFEAGAALQQVAQPRLGMATGNNDLHLRMWYEVDCRKFGRAVKSRVEAQESGAKWFPYNKGGKYRRWYGNQEYVVNWENDGQLLQNMLDPSGSRVRAHNFNLDYIFMPALTWTASSSSYFGIRYSPEGFLFDVKGSSCFPSSANAHTVLGLLASSLSRYLLDVLNPTSEFQPGNIGSLPFWVERVSPNKSVIDQIVKESIEICRDDWDAFERSWEFRRPKILENDCQAKSLTETVELYRAYCDTQTRRLTFLEAANDNVFCEIYGIEGSLLSADEELQATLDVNLRYRYPDTNRKALTESEREARFRQDTMQEMVSYAIGCMMGRYSLDEPGLIYAHSGNEGFDPSRYKKFPADDDGIIPLTDSAWFEDDAANRMVEFISVAWDADQLEDHLTFLADNLSPKKNETSRDTIRRYLCDKFFKDHLQTYKKRPIYWLFSSGKQKAFQCLVYLHRYNEGTLARMRSEYVIPLQGKLVARLEHLKADIQATDSSAQQKRLEKESDSLKKQQTELLAFDEKLRHYADRRIKLDLDDGVKENYGKFGSLLAEVKTVHGKKPTGP